MEIDPQVTYPNIDYTDAQFRHRIAKQVRMIKRYRKITLSKESEQLIKIKTLISEVRDYILYLEKCTPKTLWLEAHLGLRTFPEGLTIFLSSHRLTPSLICCLEQAIAENPITSILDIIHMLRNENFNEFLRRCAEN